MKEASKSHTPQVAAIDSSTVFIAGHTEGFVIRIMGIIIYGYIYIIYIIYI